MCALPMPDVYPCTMLTLMRPDLPLLNKLQPVFDAYHQQAVTVLLSLRSMGSIGR